MKKDICKKCGKLKDIHTKEGWCNVCYRAHKWKRKLTKCPRCERMKPHHAQGLCCGCYNSVFQVEKVKLHNAKRYHNVDFDTYKKATEKCVLCGFDKIVDLHHLDMNHKNNSPENLIGLCPNHHKMTHHREFQKEIFRLLKEKGYPVPEGYKDDKLFLKRNSEEGENKVGEETKKKIARAEEDIKHERVRKLEDVKKEEGIRNKPPHKTQNSKMKEIWDNKHDEAWDNI